MLTVFYTVTLFFLYFLIVSSITSIFIYKINLVNLFYNVFFGCKCKSIGYGWCIKCKKQYKKVSD
jgi:hypothetical protein